MTTESLVFAIAVPLRISALIGEGTTGRFGKSTDQVIDRQSCNQSPFTSSTTRGKWGRDLRPLANPEGQPRGSTSGRTTLKNDPCCEHSRGVLGPSGLSKEAGRRGRQTNKVRDTNQFRRANSLYPAFTNRQTDEMMWTVTTSSQHGGSKASSQSNVVINSTTRRTEFPLDFILYKAD